MESLLLNTGPVHINVQRGIDRVEKPKEEFSIGNTMVVVHSPLVALSKEERKQWFLDEWEKGNPILKEIAAAVHDCYQD